VIWNYWITCFPVKPIGLTISKVMTSMWFAGDAEVTDADQPTMHIDGAWGPTADDEAYTAYSWRDPRERPLDQLGLLTAGFVGGNYFTSDRVYQQGLFSALAFYSTSTSSWDDGGAGFTSVIPGEAYWISSMHENGGYDYSYSTTGSAVHHAPTSRASIISKVRPKIATPKAAVRTVKAAN